MEGWTVDQFSAEPKSNWMNQSVFLNLRMPKLSCFYAKVIMENICNL